MKNIPFPSTLAIRSYIRIPVSNVLAWWGDIKKTSDSHLYFSEFLRWLNVIVV